MGRTTTTTTIETHHIAITIEIQRSGITIISAKITTTDHVTTITVEIAADVAITTIITTVTITTTITTIKTETIDEITGLGT